MVVNVTDNNGQLTATITSPTSKDNIIDLNVIITNTYTKPTTGKPGVEKEVTGEFTPNVEREFKFTIEPKSVAAEDTSNVVMPSDNTATVKISSNGNQMKYFNNITFNAAGEYDFTIKEVVPDEKVAGIEYDDTEWTWHANVTRDEDTGELSVTDSYYADKDGKKVNGATLATFTNTFTPAEHAPEVQKTVMIFKENDETVEPATFKFKIEGADTPDESGTVATPAKKTDAANKVLNDSEVDREIEIKLEEAISSDYTKQFGKLKFTEPDVYTFKITEEQPDSIPDGWRYDPNSWTLTVMVTANSTTGALAETHSYVKDVKDGEKATTEGDHATFENEYNTPKATAAPQVKKVVTGRGSTTPTDTKDGKFTFTLQLTGDDGTATTSDFVDPNSKTGTITTNGLTSEAQKIFGDVTFTKSGTYTFTITETATVLTDGTKADFDVDDTVWTWEVEVKNVNGKLEATPKLLKDGKELSEEEKTAGFALFTNTYHAKTKVTVTEKWENGTNTQPESITVTLTGGEDEPNNAAFTKQTRTQTLTGPTWSCTWEGLEKYDADGKKIDYDVEETVPAGYVKSAGKPVSTDDGNSYTITITNTYSPASITPRVQKVVTHDDKAAPTKAKAFTFEISEKTFDPEDGATLPENNQVTITTKETGTRSFDGITFTKAGTYEFTIAETSGNGDGYTNDANDPWTLHVEVKETDKATGELGIDYDNTYYVRSENGEDKVVEIPKPVEGEETPAAVYATFTNTFTPTEYQPQVKKTVEINKKENDTVTPVTFQFAIEGANTPTESVDNPKDKAAADAVLKDVKTTADVTLPSGETGVTTEDTALFGKLTFTEPGVYTSKINETKPDPIPDGWKYDPSSWTLTVTVTSDANGALTQSHSYVKDVKEGETATPGNNECATFKNEYRTPEATAAPKVKKTVTGMDASGTEKQEGKFSFTLALTKVNDKDQSTSSNMVIANSGLLEIDTETEDETSGKAFDDVTFRASGTYTFEITENDPTDTDHFTKDNSKWIWEVKVDNVDGVLTAQTTKLYKDGNAAESNGMAEFALFDNTYHAKAKVTVKKEWVDKRGNVDHDGITVQLYRDGVAMEDANPDDGSNDYEVTLNSGNGWTHTWENLEKYCTFVAARQLVQNRRHLP